MGNRQDTDFIVEVLAEAVGRRNSGEARLANGARLRAAIKEAIKAGKPVDHYRYKWLATCSMQLLDILQIMSADFDKAHPDDMCSAQDLLDILNVTFTKMHSAYQEQVGSTQVQVQEPEE
jgi:hypothetical protein